MQRSLWEGNTLTCSPLRIRRDKSAANVRNTVLLTMKNIEEAICYEELRDSLVLARAEEEGRGARIGGARTRGGGGAIQGASASTLHGVARVKPMHMTRGRMSTSLVA